MKWLVSLLCCACLCYGAFDEESYLFEALDYETQSRFDKARDLYLVLYEETHKLEYLKEAVVLSSALNNPNATLGFANEYLALGGTKDIMLHKVFLDSYLKLEKTDEAIKEALIIYKSEPSVMLSDILGSLYATKGAYKEALEYLYDAYNASKSADIAQKIITIELSLSHQKKALELLDNHIQNYGCEGNFCQFGIAIYAKFPEFDKIEYLFKRAFDENPTIENARNLILAYTHRKKFKEASEIAAQFPFKGEILLELYAAQGDYYNASLQAKYLYEKNKNPYFLALEQVYSFESLKDKKNIAQVRIIATKLKSAIKLMQTTDKPASKDEMINASLQLNSAQMGFFLNFLGYLMIDYEINVVEGVGHIKKALEISPLNPAYLDSLAWGYYKLKDCVNAQKTFGLIPKEEVLKEPELKEHKALIDKCAVR
ncbi:ATP-dependent nuclease [Helicobacter typhlonius]|uniref:ATP-dependent nuclease n=1 Tax=Helicobacter typhlonius TaxID=76936 RepID=UPI002FE0D0DE